MPTTIDPNIHPKNDPNNIPRNTEPRIFNKLHLCLSIFKNYPGSADQGTTVVPLR